MNKLMKATCRATILIVLATLFSAGCDRSKSEDSTTTIKMIGEAYAPLDALAQIKDRFEQQTGIQVEILQKDHQAVISELDLELASRHVSYDLILMPHRLLGKLVKKGSVQAIDKYMRDPELHDSAFDPAKEFYTDWWHEISWYEGKPYGFPFTYLSMYLVYRKDLLMDAGEQARFKDRYGRALTPPKNWKEYLELAEFFNRPEEGMYGTYIHGQQHICLWYDWINLVYSFGGDILDVKHGYEYGDIVVNSPENVRATEMFVRLLDFSSPDTLNYNWDDALTVMQQGRAFMGVMWNDATPYLEDSEQSRVVGKIGYSLIPSETGKPFTQLEGWTYLIPSDSKHPREAYRFMEWAMRPDVQLAQTLKGGASPCKSTYENERVARIPYIPAFLEGIPVGIPKPTFPESSHMSEIMVRILSQIVAKQKEPAAGLNEMALKVKEILGDKARLRYPVQGG